MVQLGEKDQGCTMITGIKKQYPKASKSVLQKAQYEQKNSIVQIIKIASEHEQIKISI